MERSKGWAGLKRGSPEYREHDRKLRRAYRESLKGKFGLKMRQNYPATQRAISIKHLERALKERGPIVNGWPDAGCQEQKVAGDGISINQWRRAAWAQSKGIKLFLRFAPTHEDALYDERREVITFRNYAERFGHLDDWVRLVEKESVLTKQSNQQIIAQQRLRIEELEAEIARLKRA